MDPLYASTAVTHRRTLRFGPKATLIPIEANAESERTFTTDVHHVLAQGVGESQVEWVFRQTAAVVLDGVYHLSLVARTSARVACRAELAMAATRVEKRFGLVSYRAEVPPRVGTIRLSGLPG